MITEVKDIIPGQTNLTLVCIVLDVGRPIITRTNKELRILKISDHSACINFALYGETGRNVEPRDIIEITHAFSSFLDDSLTVYLGTNGEVRKVGEFHVTFNDSLDMSVPNPALKAQYSSAVDLLNDIDEHRF